MRGLLFTEAEQRTVVIAPRSADPHPMLVADPVRLLAPPMLPRAGEMTLAHLLEDEGHLFLRYLLAGQ